MKKEKFSGPTGGAPKHSDSKKQSANKGSSEASTKKRVGISSHKQISGPSEMKSTGGGPTHKGITGPFEMSKGEGKLGKATHVATKVTKDMHGYLGSHGDMANLKKGHKTLEKLDTSSLHDVRNHPVYGNDKNEGEDQKD